MSVQRWKVYFLKFRHRHTCQLDIIGVFFRDHYKTKLINHSRLVILSSVQPILNLGHKETNIIEANADADT